MKNLIAVLVSVFLLPAAFAAETVPPAPIPAASEPVAAPVEPVGPTYTGEAAKIKEHLEGLFDASRKVNSTNEAERKVARGQIEHSMNWPEVAKDGLGASEWGKTSVANRKAYTDLLQEIIVKTAYTRLDTFWDGAKYHFSKIDIKGPKAQATAIYKVKGESFTLDYFLSKTPKGWLIYDIAFEDIRYSENIREQIKAFLREKGFSSLLAKLKKRRDDLNENAKKKS